MKPALLALAKTALIERYRFGDRSYLEHALTLPPKLEVWDERSVPEMPPKLLAATTALGDAANAVPGTDFVFVVIILRDRKMPVDGDLELVFVVRKTTLESVCVYTNVNG